MLVFSLNYHLISSPSNIIMGKLLVNTFGIGAIGIASYCWGRTSAPVIVEPSAITPKPRNGGLSMPDGNDKVFNPSQIRPEEFYKYGFPGPIHDISQRQEFISCYNRATRNPYWVVEHITRDSIRRAEGVDRKKSIFREDESIPLNFRAQLSDYFRSGYDRGHLAPAANAKYDQTAMDETFFLSNMAPQVGDGFNRDYWASLEDFCRRLTHNYDSVRILTGPLFLPKLCEDNKFRVIYEMVGSPPSIAVPTHFFKLAVGEKIGDDSLSVAAFVLPNDAISSATPLAEFQVPIEMLERSSGLNLLHKVPARKKKDLCREVKCEIIVRELSNIIKSIESK